ncbi:MAG: acyl-CoA thioesterase [Gaiellaceae bacterium]
MFERTIDIRWRDLDALGHVNNAVYATYLEEARDRLLMQALEGITPITDFALARVAIDYKSEIVFDDRAVTATCAVLRIGNSSITTSETVTKSDGVLAASAEAVMVARDVAAKRSRPLRPDERAALEQQLAT